MPVFVTSTSTVKRHGAFAVERTPPAVIQATGTGCVALVGQFDWGPDGSVYEPSSMADAKKKFGPAGTSRLSTGYLSLIAKAYPSLRIVRVIGPTAAKATATLTAAGPTNIVVVQAKYKGTAANSFTSAVEAASDGDANHFNLRITATGASGTTEELLENLNYSGTGSDSTPDFTKLVLIGAITKSNSGRPTNGSYSFSGGTNGTVTSAEYIGTAGTGDKGIALLEGDRAVRHVCVDDCGNSLRAAVNAGLVAHKTLMGDRMVYINGNSGLTAAATQTDVASYRSKGVAYADSWVRIYDEVTGALQLVPPAPFLASVSAQLSPSTSPAWKNSKVKDMLAGIVELESDRCDNAGTNTDKGICTIIKELNGGFTFEAAINTNAPSDPSTKNLTRDRMGHYIAVSFVDSVRENVDSPNVATNRDEILSALDSFMKVLKRNATTNPNLLPHVIDYAVLPADSVNTDDDYAEGNFFAPLDVKLSSGMERIFLSIRYGERVTVTVS